MIGLNQKLLEDLVKLKNSTVVDLILSQQLEIELLFVQIDWMQHQNILEVLKML